MAKQTELVLTDKQTAVLEAITLKREEFLDWVKTADSLVVTPQTLKDADAYRIKGKNMRLEVQRIVAKDNDMLKALKKKSDARETFFIGTVSEGGTDLEAAEKRLAARIKAVEDAIEAEQLAKLKAEEDRKRAIKNRITQIENMVSMVRASDDIAELNKIWTGVELETDTFSEFNEDGNAAVKQIVTAIQNRIGILEDEKELQARKTAKIASRKEMLANYPTTYWPTDEELGMLTQDEFKEVIIFTNQKFRADQIDKEADGEVKADAEDVQKEVGGGESFEKQSDQTIKIPNPTGLMGNSIPHNGGTNPAFNWRDETISDSPDRRTHPLRNDEAFKLNHFSVNGMWFGLDEKLPFAFASSIRQAIEKILSA